MSTFQACPQFADTGTCTYGDKCKLPHLRESSASSTQSSPASSPQRKKLKMQPPTSSQFTEFFDEYPEFDYDPGQSSIHEFRRLCESNGWERKDPECQQATQEFKNATVNEFNDVYGTDENDIASWHKICAVVNIHPLPDTLKEARDAVLSKHINLVDLVDNPGGQVTSFPSLEDLRKYTVKEKKYFPAGNACKFQHIQGSAIPSSIPRLAPGRRKKSKKRRSNTTQFTTFFEDYPGFDYNPRNSAILEFYRLCDFYSWDRDDPERKEAHEAFKDALVKEFNDIYGTDENDIESWHKICTVLDIDPLPGTLQEARDEVLSKHINLVDLVDNPTGHVRSFPSLGALSAYTISTGKFFPKGTSMKETGGPVILAADAVDGSMICQTFNHNQVLTVQYYLLEF
ncbi:hypothetical protein EYR36_008482 [Pleurotus pulmonarius]|nr:hypothetical protein EYR36_008482 [Pleurotus pulmonarius]